MSIARLIRIATGGPEDRRTSPRKRCRLNCTIARNRKRIPARVLDVSEGGLCLLSPVQLQAKERVVIHINVPPRGPVKVEAVAWHVRKVKSGRSGRKTWSIGMMLSRADDGFQKLLDSGRQAAPTATPSGLSAAPEQPDLESDEISPEWDEWSSEWDQLFEESEKLLAESTENTPQDDLQAFRVRVKAKMGPRTRTLTLSAASEEEAADMARQDLDDSWQIIEVTPA